MPSPTRITTPAEGWNQNKQRAYAFWYDQHKCPQFPDGRPWWSVVERPADGAAMPMPVGEVQPVGWAAPWFPPPHLITRSIGRSKPGASMYEHRFVIDYGSLVADDSASMREYYRRAAQAAAQLKEPIPQYGQDVSWGLAQIIGSPPRSPKIGEAALAGDEWLLGFSDVVNKPLARLIDMGGEKFMTAIEADRTGNVVEEMRQQLEELRALVAAQIAADGPRAAAPRPKRGRPPKTQTVDTGA
jgi:hypothetical protein